MREFKYGVGVIAPNFLLNLLLVKMSEKSSTKADFQGENQKDTSDNGTIKDLSSSLLTRLHLKRHSIEREEVKVCRQTLEHPQHHRPSVRFNRSNSSKKVLEWVSVVQVKNTWPLFSMKHFANFFMPLSPLAARDSLCFVCIVVGRRLVLLQVNSVHQASSK